MGYIINRHTAQQRIAIILTAKNTIKIDGAFIGIIVKIYGFKRRVLP
jgi:hypothetical protein